MHRSIEFHVSQFHIMPDQSITALADGLLLQGHVPGFAIYGPYVPMAAGVYAIEIVTDPSAPGSALFDVYAEGRVYGERDLSSSSALAVRLFDTDSLEIRIKCGTPGFVFKGARVTPLLIDTEVVALDETLAIARRLIDEVAEPDAVFAVVDRLIGMGEPARAEDVKAEFLLMSNIERLNIESIARATAKVLERLNCVHGLVAREEVDLSSEINRSEIKDALKRTNLLVIDLFGISVETRSQLQDLGYATGFLDATRLSRSKTEPVRSWQKLPGGVPVDGKRRASQVSRQAELDLGFQIDLACGRGLTAYCPCSGRELLSRHGFIQYMNGMAFLLYRFDGVEPFYVAVGNATGSRLFMYMPRSETILLLQDPGIRWYSNEDVVRLFRINLAANAAKVIEYLASSTRPAAVYGNNNLGHFIWNDLAGLQAAHDRQALPHICETVELRRQFLPVHEIFPELSSVPSTYFEDEAAVFQYCLDRGLLPIRFTDTFISESLSERIRRASMKDHNRRLALPPPTGKPLLWINLRAHTKIWIDQASHYVNIINAIAADYDGVSVFFDGFSDVRGIIDDIRPKLDASVICHDGLGMSLLDSINWAFYVDAYVCPIGSGLVLVSWLANKPGVTHAEHAHMNQLEWWGTVRQSAIAPLAPSPSEIRDVGGGLYCNYELDWTVVLSLLRQALNGTHFARLERNLAVDNAALQSDGGEGPA